MKCSDGLITFVELKRMSDNRMLHKTEATPEVVYQMNRYKQFINKYYYQLLEYYQKLYDIKKSLELPVPETRPIGINRDPELLIFDCWEKNTKNRDTHRNRVRDILQNEKVKFNIISDL